MTKFDKQPFLKKGVYHRWGHRFITSIFPIQEGKAHRITVKYKDKSKTFAGKDRMKVFDMAFDYIRGKNI